MAKKNYNLQFDPDLMARVDQIAKNAGKSRQRWIADVLQRVIENEEKEGATPSSEK